MARWKLMAAAYLNVPGEIWEYKETDRATGKQRRIELAVPMLVDPNDPGVWTNKWGNRDNLEGEVIVCLKDKGERSDLVFLGDPTPDMIPLDDEAREITASHSHRWSYKPDDPASEQNYSTSLINRFEEEMKAAANKPVEVPGLGDLTAAIAKMAESNAAMVAAMSGEKTRRA